MKKFILGTVLALAVAAAVYFVIAALMPAHPKGDPSFFSVRFSLPEGYYFTKDAPYKIECRPGMPQRFHPVQAAAQDPLLDDPRQNFRGPQSGDLLLRKILRDVLPRHL